MYVLLINLRGTKYLEEVYNCVGSRIRVKKEEASSGR